MLSRLFHTAALTAVTLLCAESARAQNEDVSVQLMLVNADGSRAPVAARRRSDTPLVVVWLSPAKPIALPTLPRQTYKMVQKNKEFAPHLLVVPVGSEVSFPNLDPYFHNVFSLFNGRRFDLGLYETGSQRSVVFPKEGVSYIFCNIHPQMGAVIISLATPYFVEGRAGLLVVPHVPIGEYVIHTWSDEALPLSLAESAKNVTVKSAGSNAIEVHITVQPAGDKGHLNKYGEPYPAPDHSLY